MGSWLGHLCFQFLTSPPGGPPYNGLYREAPPEKGTLFMLQVYEREGISVAELYEWVGKSVISAGKKAQKGQQIHFIVEKKSRKRSGFVIYSYFKDTALKGM